MVLGGSVDAVSAVPFTVYGASRQQTAQKDGPPSVASRWYVGDLSYNFGILRSAVVPVVE